MDPFYIGLLGSLVLVLGAAWPAKKIKNPRKSVKNWLFASGAFFMLGFSYLNYLGGGAVFYIFLQLLANIASLCLLLNFNKKYSIVFIILSSIAFIAASITYLKDLFTILFILGLAFIAVGYVIESGTVKRNAALMIGSVFIGVYSYIEGTMIFFWLNVFFAIFSLFHVYKLSSKKKN